MNFKTTTPFGRGKKAHTHILFLDDANGQGFCAITQGHKHELQFIPPTPPNVDELGQPLDDGSPGGWLLLPSEDGHTHEIIDLVVKPPERHEKEADVVAEMLSLFRNVIEDESASFKNADQAEKFYKGEQWSEKDKAYLEGMDRACITNNEIERHLNILFGHQREQRTQFQYAPVEGGDQRVADLLNIAANLILEKSNYQLAKSEVFEDQAITGRGNWILGISFDEDIRGEIKVERLPWKHCRYGPHDKIDGTDCEIQFRDRMYSITKLKSLYPTKADRIEKDYNFFLTSPLETVHHYTGKDNYALSDNRKILTLGGELMVNLYRKEYRVIECWRKVWMKSAVVANPTLGIYENAYGWKPGDLEQARTLPGFYVIERNVPKIRITKVAGGVLLSDEYPADLPIDDFFMVPVYGKKRDKKFWGKVEPAIDPQMEVNKRHSQAIDIGNKMCAYGWFIDQTTFPDTTAKEKFKRNAMSPGFVQEVTNAASIPVQIEGVKFPSEIVQLLEISSNSVAQSMNIQVEQGGANESGAHLMHRQKMKLVGNEFLFDNMRQAEKKIAKLLLALIKRYYSADRLYRLVVNQAAKEEMQLGGQPFEEFTEEDIVTLLETTDLLQYDVVVTEADYSPSARLGTYFLLSELGQTGTPVPPEVLIDLAPIPDAQKQKILTSITQQQAAEAEAAQSAADAEIKKTLIAQGMIPPDVQQEILQAPAPGGEEQFVETDQGVPQDALTQ